MAIVSFWSKGRKETGKTSALIALATHMAIEHNYRILVISTSYNDSTMRRAFWKESGMKKNLGLFGPNTNVAIQNGIEGLYRFIVSNKANANVITNYTKIVFKDRLEVLLGYEGEKNAESEKYYDEIKQKYPAIIDIANQFYDLVMVDVDKDLGEELEKEIIHASDLIVTTIAQRRSSLDDYLEAKETNQIFKSPKNLLLIGRYDKFSKYTSKNISRYLREKNQVNCVPYNTMFFEACDEAYVDDLILSFRRIKDETDRNAVFVKELQRLSDNIIYRLQDLQMRKA